MWYWGTMLYYMNIRLFCPHILNFGGFLILHFNKLQHSERFFFFCFFFILWVGDILYNIGLHIVKTSYNIIEDNTNHTPQYDMLVSWMMEFNYWYSILKITVAYRVLRVHILMEFVFYTSNISSLSVSATWFFDSKVNEPREANQMSWNEKNVIKSNANVIHHSISNQQGHRCSVYSIIF